MRIMNDLIPDAECHTGLVLVRIEEGRIIGGFVLRPDQFVTSITELEDARKMAGLSVSSYTRGVTDL
ncbi:hypothetical protein UZS93_14045 [Escherichia coli]|nr:hypothetical protein [Escherichia coli]MDY8958419.1 hypothetical protein [Escherichia coli]MDY8997133.1 hypothetical protein [Escherichia coli]MDY9034218.1 hypothetical protein [Escherichia coli]